MTHSIEVLRDAAHLQTGDPPSMVFVRTLGAASIDAGATHLTPSSTRKFSLLFYLWAERGRSVTRGTLHDMIFPDQPSTKARHSIRELIYQFRKLGARIASDDETVELAHESVRADYSDVLRQERPSIDLMRAAEGGFMPGYAPPHSEAFTEWLEAFRGRATRELNRVFCGELDRARRVGDWTLAEAAARAVLALDPLHEEATLSMAEMLAIGGAKAQAVRMLDRYVAEVGSSSPDLKVPATVLRRRISERSRDIYRAPLTLPFLGRDAEMSALQERFTRARAGEAQCAVLVGEAGIGKTRLAEELCTQAVLAGASVERVVTQPHDTHRPMATFADLVPKLLELPGALGCSPESMAALRRLTSHDAVDVATEAAEANSEVVAAAISRALSDLVDSIASESPLVIFVDDAQWTDERSRQTLAALTSARHARRLLILLTSRDRTVAQFIAQRSERAVGLPLVPLTDRSAKELADRALHEQASADQQLRAWIASTSGGNPFFLKCLIDHFQATGEKFVVPTSLSVLLDQKISALSPNAVALLGTCVALGRHSHLERVVKALEMPQIDLQLAAAELERANLVVAVGPKIESAHSLVGEAVGRLASPVVLRLVHRRVASVLEAEAHSPGSAVLLWDCAEHWAAAGEQERAADFLKRCATRAIEIGRPREAAELLLRAATMVGRDAAISIARRSTEIADGAHEGDVVRRGISLLRQLGVPIESDSLELAELHALTCEWDNPRYLCERLCVWLGSTAPLPQRVRAATEMAVVAEVNDRPEMAQHVDSLIATLPNPDKCADCPTLMLLLIYHCVFGDLDQADAIVRQLLGLAASVDAAVAADIYRKCGVALWRLGRMREAIAAFEKSYADAKDVGLIKVQFDAATILAGAYIDLREADADVWLRILDSMIAENGELATRPAYTLLRLDVACCGESLAEAQMWLDAGERLCETNPVVRVQRWIHAARLRVRHLEGDLPTESEAKRVLERHRPNREVGDIGDFEVAVVLRVLTERGAPETAGDLLANYFATNRRTLNPPSRMLREAIDALPSEIREARSNAIGHARVEATPP